MSLRQLSAQRPVIAAVCLAAFQFLLTFFILKLGQALAPPAAFGKVKLLAFASTIILPLVMVQVLGLWRQIGIEFGKLKAEPFFFAGLLICAIYLSLGVQVGPQRDIGSDLLIQIPNAFGEELLFRGVIFALLLGLPQWRAIMINGLLFGAMHLLHGFMGASWEDALTRAGLTAISGMMFTAVRYRCASLWLLVFLHMAINMSKLYGTVQFMDHDTLQMVNWAGYLFETALVIYVVVRDARRTGRHAEAGMPAVAGRS